jgi:hypothetical protein
MHIGEIWRMTNPNSHLCFDEFMIVEKKNERNFFVDRLRDKLRFIAHENCFQSKYWTLVSKRKYT